MDNTRRGFLGFMAAGAAALSLNAVDVKPAWSMPVDQEIALRRCVANLRANGKPWFELRAYFPGDRWVLVDAQEMPEGAKKFDLATPVEGATGFRIVLHTGKFIEMPIESNDWVVEGTNDRYGLWRSINHTPRYVRRDFHRPMKLTGYSIRMHGDIVHEADIFGRPSRLTLRERFARLLPWRSS